MLELLGGLLALRPQACALGAAHLIHRLIHMADDMEAIQHVQSLTDLGLDYLQVGLPHVAAHKTQPFDDFRPQFLQAPSQRCLRAPPSYPQQSAAMPVDLVDDRQKIVGFHAVPPMNFVHPMASIPRSWRSPKPQCTNHSTDR